MDETALVRLAKGCGDADSEAQETSRLHRRAEEVAEQFAAGILEHQDGLTAVLHKFKRPHGPRAVQLILESVFVGKAIENIGRWLLRGREYDEYISTPTFGALAPPAAEDEPTIL